MTDGQRRRAALPLLAGRSKNNMSAQRFDGSSNFVQGLQRMNHTDFDESPKLSCGATRGLMVLAFSVLCGK